MFKSADRIVNRLATGALVAALGLTLCGCMSTSSLDQLGSATPSGSPFAQNLFKNYAYLARSFGPSTNTSDGGMFDFFGSGSETNDLAEVFATKALIAAKGVEVEPEPANGAAGSLRDRLVSALAAGKGRFAVDAARAQADFDCWMLNSSVSAQRGAAEQCHASFNSTLGRLEQDTRRRV
jgi:ABC-type glycerol-3-phosphate transport system substrate-binding protein